MPGFRLLRADIVGNVEPTTATEQSIILVISSTVHPVKPPEQLLVNTPTMNAGPYFPVRQRPTTPRPDTTPRRYRWPLRARPEVGGERRREASSPSTSAPLRHRLLARSEVGGCKADSPEMGRAGRRPLRCARNTLGRPKRDIQSTLLNEMMKTDSFKD